MTYGHMQRLPTDAPVKQALHEATAKKVKNPTGGQRTTWLKTVENDFIGLETLTGQEIKSLTQVDELALDRKKYAQLVASVRERSPANKC